MRALADERDPAELRQLLRSWLADNASPTPRQLAEAGLVAPHWPRPWGLDADPHLQLVIADELATAGVSLPENQIGIGWAGPTILTGGTEEQHRRWLPGILDGSQTWTQLFSEPDAGSDLASLRTSAVRDGDHYLVDGQKIWSTWANHAQWGILLARTDATVPRHRGISYFIVDMSSPGVEVRKVIEMTGGNHFNETFLNEVRIPVENRIGDEGDGWRLASVTLGNERVSLSEGGVLWGMGPTFEECVQEMRRRGAGEDPVTRQRSARAYSDGFVSELLTHKIVEAVMNDEDPSPYASIRKARTDANAQAMLELMTDLAGPDGMLGIQDEEAAETDPWHWASCSVEPSPSVAAPRRSSATSSVSGSSGSRGSHDRPGGGS
ncbi:MAG: acyl-CoA dehydrogenase family protein [Microthrixaceae bacterium]